ncbi:MAG TPA: hypothetical protein VMK05_14120 [Burkholderiales bacterium]|nr:hypothetical protein [Burkholderiales bacterium]
MRKIETAAREGYDRPLAAAPLACLVANPRAADTTVDGIRRGRLPPGGTCSRDDALRAPEARVAQGRLSKQNSAEGKWRYRRPDGT